MLSLDRFIFAPTVVKTGQTVMLYDDFLNSVEQIGAIDALETEGTPLSEIAKRIGDDTHQAGNADDISEFAGRQCYRSFSKGRGNEDYIENILTQQHGSVMEHASLVFQVAGVSRSLTHELIRHRVGTGYSQESQRYVNADAADVRFVVPPVTVDLLEGMSDEEILREPEFVEFAQDCARALDSYVRYQKRLHDRLSAKGLSGTALKKKVNEAARAHLPNAAETRLIFTCNMRALRHIILLRGGDGADMEIRRFANHLLAEAADYAPNIFRDVMPIVDGDEFGIATLKSLYGAV